jgi:hypothetical protein
VATADPDDRCIGDCDGGALDVMIRFSLGSFNGDTSGRPASLAALKLSPVSGYSFCLFGSGR